MEWNIQRVWNIKWISTIPIPCASAAYPDADDFISFRSPIKNIYENKNVSRRRRHRISHIIFWCENSRSTVPGYVHAVKKMFVCVRIDQSQSKEWAERNANASHPYGNRKRENSKSHKCKMEFFLLSLRSRTLTHASDANVRNSTLLYLLCMLVYARIDQPTHWHSYLMLFSRLALGLGNTFVVHVHRMR